MSVCSDYWCENYGKASGQCDRCDKKNEIKDKPDLRIILRDRTKKMAESSNNQNKGMFR